MGLLSVVFWDLLSNDPLVNILIAQKSFNTPKFQFQNKLLES